MLSWPTMGHPSLIGHFLFRPISKCSHTTLHFMSGFCFAPTEYARALLLFHCPSMLVPVCNLSPALQVRDTDNLWDTKQFSGTRLRHAIGVILAKTQNKINKSRNLPFKTVYSTWLSWTLSLNLGLSSQLVKLNFLNFSTFDAGIPNKKSHKAYSKKPLGFLWKNWKKMIGRKLTYWRRPNITRCHSQSFFPLRSSWVRNYRFPTVTPLSFLTIMFSWPSLGNWYQYYYEVRIIFYLWSASTYS